MTMTYQLRPLCVRQILATSSPLVLLDRLAPPNFDPLRELRQLARDPRPVDEVTARRLALLAGVAEADLWEMV